MTETEYLGFQDLREVLGRLSGTERVSGRKLRLWVCGCVRLIWGHLTDPRCCRLIEAAERLADGEISEGQLAPLCNSINVAAEAFGTWLPYLDTHTIYLPGYAHPALQGAALRAAQYAGEPNGILLRRLGLVSHYVACVAVWGDETRRATTTPAEVRAELVAERRIHCDLLRDITGNPFRPSFLDSAWQTPSVLALAQAAYEERFLPAGTLDADRLAVLADALEEDGCDKADILGHLRGPGPHVRGCWAVDLILSKA